MFRISCIYYSASYFQAHVCHVHDMHKVKKKARKEIMGTLEQLSYIHEIKQLKLEVAKLTEDNKRLVELIKILRK